MHHMDMFPHFCRFVKANNDYPLADILVLLYSAHRMPRHGPSTHRSPPAANNSIGPRRHPVLEPEEDFYSDVKINRGSQQMVRLMGMLIVACIAMLILYASLKRAAQKDWQTQIQNSKQSRMAVQNKGEVAPAAPLPPPGYDMPFIPDAGAYHRHIQRLGTFPLVSERDFWFVMANAYMNTETTLAEAALYLAMANIGETAELYNTLGILQLRREDAAAAQRKFHAALQLDPLFNAAHFNSVLADLMAGNRTAAGIKLKHMIARHPSDIQAIRLYTTLLAQNGDRRGAFLVLKAALADNPALPDLYLDAAIQAARFNETGTAIHYLERALQYVPVENVLKVFQSPAFREIRRSEESLALREHMAQRAREALAGKTATGHIPVPIVQPRKSER